MFRNRRFAVAILALVLLPIVADGQGGGRGWPLPSALTRRADAVRPADFVVSGPLAARAAAAARAGAQEPAALRPAILGGDDVPDIIVGSGRGDGLVRVLSGVDGREIVSGEPFGPDFEGGVRVAAGDVNGDGVADVIVGQGLGGAQVRIFDGAAGTVIASFTAFVNFTGGVHLAAGDVNADGYADIVVGAGAGGGHVRVFSGADRSEIAAGYPFGGAYAGGVTVALGDLNGDGRLDYITGMALGGLVSAFDGATIAPIASGFPYGVLYFGGVAVAAGDMNGDGRAEVITAAQLDILPPVRVFEVPSGTMIASFAPHPDALGARVAVGDINGDGYADLITGAGLGGAPQVRVFSGQTREEILRGLVFAPTFTGGVFVASTANPFAVRFTSQTAATFNEGAANSFTITTAGAVNPPITLQAGTLPSGVTMTDHGNGTATLAGTPAAGTAGTHLLTFHAGFGAGVTQSFTLTVNDLPVAANDNYSVNEGGTLTTAAPGVIANDTNLVGTPLTASLVAGPAQAATFTLNPDGSFTYVHDGSETPLTDTFTYRLNDGTLDSNVATVTITIAPQPDPPVAAADAYSVAEGGTLSPAPAAGVLANDTDADTTTLTATLVSGPAQASAFALNADGSFTYTHNGSETTTDSFTYRASDGGLTSDVATVVLTITPVNDAPVANADAVTVNEGATATQAAPGLLANDTDAEGSALTAVLVSGPAHAAAFALNADGSFSYTHDGSETPLSDAFTYRANDGSLDSNVATVTITIVPVNDAPVAVNDAFSVAEGGTLSITVPGVLGNDSDVDSAGRTAVLVAGPAQAAAFTLNADGSFTYTHNGSETLTDAFTYRANDGSLDSNVATVTLTITPVDDAPVAADDGYSVAEGGTLSPAAAAGVLANDADPDSVGLTAVLVAGPAQASAFTLNADGSFSYTHNGSETVTDSFTYQASDGVLPSNLATVTITITPVNDAPVLDLDADDSGGTTGADAAVTFTENNPATLLEDPADATIADADSSTLATLTVTLTNLLDAGQEQLDVDLTGFPAFGKNYDTTTTVGQGILTIFGTGGPEAIADFQTLVRRVTYQHSGDNPSATARVVTFSAFDGTTASNTATSTVTIVPVDDPPAAVDDNYSVNESGTLTVPAPGVLANDTDAEGSALTAELLTPPANHVGVFTLNADGSFAYTHDGSETASDSFTYRVFAGGVPSAPATMTIAIGAVNDAPIAVNDGYGVNEGATLNVPAATGVLANDTDAEGALTAQLVPASGPAHAASFTLNPDGSFTYQHDGSETPLTDSFTYQAFDGAALSNVATVTLTITPVNDGPVIDLDADDDKGTTGVNFAVAFTEGDPATLIEDDDTVGGAVITDADTATLTTLTIRLTNLLDPTDEVLDVDLTGADPAFSKAYDVVSVPGEGILTITASPARPIAEFETLLRTVSYLNSDENPDATARVITFVANDGTSSGPLATTTVTLTPVNDPPTADNDSYSLTGGSTLTIPAPGVLDGDLDPEGATLTAVLDSGPAHATTFTLNPDGSFTYVHDGTVVASDSFTYHAHDGALDSTIATVTITFNAPPVAVDDVGATTEDAVLGPVAAPGVLGNDTDADVGDTKTIAAVNGSPANVGTAITTAGGATLTLNANGSYTYDPTAVAAFQALPAGQSTTDSFTYVVQDGGGLQDTGLVTITIDGVNDTPAGTNTAVATNEDTPYTFTVADFGFTDPVDNPDDALLAVRMTTLPSAGTLTLSGAAVVAGQSIPVANITAGNLVFTPVANASGAPYASFTFQVQDAGGTANGGVDLDPSANTLTVNVTSLNDAPAGTSNTITMNEDATRPFTAADFGFTDPNDTPANTLQSVVITTLPAAGSLTLSGAAFAAGTEITVADITAGNLVFAPAAGASGAPYASFTFQVRDNGGTANGGVDLDASANTFTINVTSVNDAPSGTNTTVTTDEDVQYTFTVANFGFTDPNDTPANALQSVVITTLPAVGSLTLSGAGFGAGTEIPVASITAGNLRYLSPLNAFGSPFTTFTFQVRDNGGVLNGGVDLDPSADTMTINVNPVNDAPAVVNETFDVLGNTELRVDMTAGTTPHTSETTPNPGAVEGVLDNDSDPEGDPFTVTGITGCTVADTTAPFDCTLADGAVVHVDANGEFSYTPGPGDTAGSFTYTVTDTPAAGAPAVATGTVSFTVFEMVWYVQNNAAAGNGTSISPLNALASLNNTGSDLDGADDYIFVRFGDGNNTNQASGLELETNQRLVGEFSGLSVPVNLNGNGSPTVVVAQPGGTACSGGPCRPLISNTTTNNAISVTEAMPAQISGFRITGGPTSGNAIDVTTDAALSGSTTLTIADNVFNGAGAEGLDVNMGTGTTGTLALAVTSNSWNNAATHTGNAVDISHTAGAGTLNLNFSGNSNIESAANAVSISGGAVANTNITGFAGNNIHVDTGGAGILITNVTFDAVAGGAIQQVDGDNLVIGADGGGAGNVGGSGMSLVTVQGSLFFDSLQVYGGTTGLSVTGTGSGMTLAVTPNTSGGTSELKGANGAAVDVTSAALDLRLAELASTTGAGAVSLNTVTGQFGAPSGSSISKTSGGGTAFSVLSSGATVTYAGSMNVTSGAGVSLTGNSGTMTFSGGMTLSTGTNAAFNATGGGIVNVCATQNCSGSAVINTLATSSGTALNVNGPDIGASGLTFRSIGSSGASSGIILQDTGTTAGLTVTGTGGAGTGGIITGSTGAGVVLTNTAAINLASMNIQNSADDGIRGTGVNGFTLTGVNVTSNGNAVGDRGIELSQLSGTGGIANSSITGSAEHNVIITNDTANLTSFNVTNTTVGTSNFTTGDDGILVLNTGSANMTVSVTGSTFTDNKGDHFQAASDADASGTMNITFNNNTLSTTASHDDGLGTDDVIGGGITINTSGTLDITFQVNGNNLQQAFDDGININLDPGSQAGASMNGTISGNTIGTSGVQDSGSESSNAITIAAKGLGSVEIAVTNNQIFEWTNISGIMLMVTEGSAFLDAAVTGNTFHTTFPQPLPTNAIHANVGATAGDNGTLELTLTGNDVTGEGNPAAADADIRLRQRFNTTIKLPGYGGANNDTAAVNAFVAANNDPAGATPAPTVSSIHNVGGGGGGFIGGADTLVAASGGVDAAQPSERTVLTGEGLDSIVEAAMKRWTAIGLSAEQLAAMRDVTFEIVSLQDRYLGSVSGNRITVDADAAGAGWFVDTTPMDDAEFSEAASGMRRYTDPAGAPAGRMDLLTAVMHELGHRARLHDAYATANRDDVMFGYLTKGERRVPVPADPKR